MEGDQGSGSRNSKDASHMTVPEKQNIGLLASKEHGTHRAGSKMREAPVPGCLALTTMGRSPF